MLESRMEQPVENDLVPGNMMLETRMEQPVENDLVTGNMLLETGVVDNLGI